MVPEVVYRDVAGAAYSVDGKHILTWSEDGTARIWEAATGKAISEPLRHQGAVLSAALSPGGRFVVTASVDNMARIWDLSAKDPAANPVVLRGHESGVNAVAISPDNRWLVTASADKTARIWDLSAKDPAANPVVLRGHEGSVNAVAISPDNHWLVTASNDKTARLWDLSAKDPAANPVVLRGHESGVNAVAISPDNRWLVTASNDKTARLWDLSAKDPAANPVVLRGHEGSVNAVAISPDNRWLVTASNDKTARLWEVVTDKALGQPLRHEGPVVSAAFSPDARFVVTASVDKTAQVWDTSNGQPITDPLGHEAIVYSASFSPQGTQVVTVSQDKLARVWNVGLNQLTAARLLDDLTTVVVARGGLGVWNSESGEELSRFVPLSDEITALAHRLGSDWLVGATAANQTLRWNLKRPDRNPELLQILPPARARREAPTPEISLSHDGALLAKLEGPESDLRIEIFKTDGRRVEVLPVPSGLKGRKARLFNAGTKTLREGAVGDRFAGSFALPTDSSVPWPLGPDSTPGTTYNCFLIAEGETIAVEDHGSVLAIGKNSGEVEVWQPSENRRLWSSKIHKGPVSAVAISSDGSLLATAGADNSVNVHLASSGEFLAREGSFSGDLLDLKFSTDGHRLGAISTRGQSPNLECSFG